MADDITLSDAQTSWDILPSMEVQFPGRRNRDGTISCLLMVPIRNPAFGPFLRLAQGRYRLDLVVEPGAQVFHRDHPVVGVEIIAQNRILKGCRDFTTDELRQGLQQIYFDVPSPMAIESGTDVPFEFRFKAFGLCAFTVRHLTLTKCASNEEIPPQPMAWRLLGRMKLWPFSRHTDITPLSVNALKFIQPWTPVYLPAGLFQLNVDVKVKTLKNAQQEALEICLITREGQEIASGVFSGTELCSEQVSILFEMPADLSYDGGAPQSLCVRIRQFGTARLSLRGIDIRSVSETPPPEKKLPAPSLKVLGNKKRLVIFGNCQGGILANAMRHQGAFSRRFTVKHHSFELPANLHEQGRRDLENADVLLVQDIREWEQYPLREHVPDHLEMVKYPCIRFASPWPFDAFNGPDDRFARDKDYPNFEFTYFDGLLARLRHDVPNHQERFEAYRDLKVKGAIDPKRLHAFEEKRLRAMDEKFSIDIGAFILENFRKKPVFYTTAHPNGTILRMLLKYIARELGVRSWIVPSQRLDALRTLQIPIHPRVAAALDVKWANEKTLYMVRGEKVTWEDYVRKYISYYG